MEGDESQLETLREHFEQYINYVGAPRADAGILKVSYQFLSDNPEHHLTEVVAFMRRTGPAEARPAFRVIPGFRR